LNKHELPVLRHAAQSAAAVPEVLETTVEGVTGITTVPSVPVPLIAARLGRRMCSTDPELMLSTYAIFVPSIERTGDVVTGPPLPVFVL
jgi:hypothetical protein